MIKSRRMRWAGHAARMRERRGVYRVLVEKPERRVLLENPSVDGRTVLRRILKKWNVEAWTGLIWIRIGTGVGHL
jgi:hypothetical protein